MWFDNRCIDMNVQTRYFHLVYHLQSYHLAILLIVLPSGSLIF